MLDVTLPCEESPGMTGPDTQALKYNELMYADDVERTLRHIIEEKTPSRLMYTAGSFYG